MSQQWSAEEAVKWTVWSPSNVWAQNTRHTGSWDIVSVTRQTDRWMLPISTVGKLEWGNRKWWQRRTRMIVHTRLRVSGKQSKCSTAEYSNVPLWPKQLDRTILYELERTFFVTCYTMLSHWPAVKIKLWLRLKQHSFFIVTFPSLVVLNAWLLCPRKVACIDSVHGLGGP